jgi:hypothetical protein
MKEGQNLFTNSVLVKIKKIVILPSILAEGIYANLSLSF